MDGLKAQLRTFFTPEKTLAVYRLKWRDQKGTIVTGLEARSQFLPDPPQTQAYYDLIFHDILTPLSPLPLDSLLAVDFADLLPDPHAPDFPEQCLGMITILDQTRVLTGGSYNARYIRCFFVPICERLVQQLAALPEDVRPDGKRAWLSRGYTYEQWLARVLMVWAPLVHSDKFMVNDRQRVKDFLHSMRENVESHYGVQDPFARLEAADDVDIQLFPKMIQDGPPEKSFENPEKDLAIWEYAFWWIRILNAHFALTDMCGNYPYAKEWNGMELSERDKEYLEKTNYALYNRDMKPVFEQVRRDVKEGVWQPLEPISQFEKQ